MVFSAATVGAPRCPTTGTREQAVARSPAPVVAAGTTSEEIGRAGREREQRGEEHGNRFVPCVQ
ncbi:hypothetical protein GCM10020229_65950 [Kitasatospora albolonga]